MSDERPDPLHLRLGEIADGATAALKFAGQAMERLEAEFKARHVQLGAFECGEAVGLVREALTVWDVGASAALQEVNARATAVLTDSTKSETT